MKIAMMAVLLALPHLTLVPFSASAHQHELESFDSKPILADLKDLRALNIPVFAKEEGIEVGMTYVTPLMLQRLQERAHEVGKCGGYEDLSGEVFLQGQGMSHLFTEMVQLKSKNEAYERAPFKILALQKQASIESALTEVSEANLLETVQWLSAFPTRNSRDAQPNRHVTALRERLEAMMRNSLVNYEISEITHSTTKQNTLLVRLPGAQRPQETIILGGHLDSITQSWGGGKTAPGADDNASGSANLVEALRILSTKPQPQRTIEFMWYAAEEVGLVGSADIAKRYKAEKKDVVAVLQLDMTLFAGSGELVIGSMTDFTSAWLRDYLKAANEMYINARVVEDKCGYGCSDHASWHRQGYPTLMPFEATFRGSNPNIHTTKDVISVSSNFKHSAAFTRIALVFGMDLANSTERQPF